MRAFTDPKVHKIVMVAASQVGKSELELNIIGYIIDQDPGSILYVHPTIDDARSSAGCAWPHDPGQQAPEGKGARCQRPRTAATPSSRSLSRAVCSR